jgi:hypothetical protein
MREKPHYDTETRLEGCVQFETGVEIFARTETRREFEIHNYALRILHVAFDNSYAEYVLQTTKSNNYSSDLLVMKEYELELDSQFRPN